MYINLCVDSIFMVFLVNEKPPKSTIMGLIIPLRESCFHALLLCFLPHDVYLSHGMFYALAAQQVSQVKLPAQLGSSTVITL